MSIFISVVIVLVVLYLLGSKSQKKNSPEAEADNNTRILEVSISSAPEKEYSFVNVAFMEDAHEVFQFAKTGKTDRHPYTFKIPAGHDLRVGDILYEAESYTDYYGTVVVTGFERMYTGRLRTIKYKEVRRVFRDMIIEKEVEPVAADLLDKPWSFLAGKRFTLEACTPFYCNMIEHSGGTASARIAKNTDYLVVEDLDDPGPKAQTAQKTMEKYGVKIETITYKQLIELTLKSQPITPESTPEQNENSTFGTLLNDNGVKKSQQILSTNKNERINL